ncbi:MAG: class IV adenylate cyclase [Pirellulaceae bacterium]
MKYEVEQKFRVGDGRRIETELEKLGSPFGAPFDQVDHYFAHPCRDFAETDEALRIRHVGHRAYITYKGPKIDDTTKTRREIELPLPEGDEGADGFAALIEALGFSRVIEIRKTRRKAHVSWQGRTVEAVLDEVATLGRFVELELPADASEVDAAKRCVADLARELGLTQNERRSYLEMLLDREESVRTHLPDDRGSRESGE